MAVKATGSRTVLPNGTVIFDGSGSPEGVVTAPPGSLYSDIAGPTYQKVAGAGNTGWYRLRPIHVSTTAPTDTTVVWIDSN